jgi:hypothetical protein
MTSGVQLRQGVTAGSLWAQELEAIAARADALQRRPEPPTLPELVELAGEAHRYLFLAFTPAVIARSCRLAARLHVPVLSVPPLDEQVDEVHQVRWRVHDQTGDVPAPEGPPAPAPCPPGLELEQEEPEPPPAPIGRPRPQLRPASERMRRPAPEPAPAPAEPPPPSTPPAGWLLAPEVAELLETTDVSIGRWRAAGRFGGEGEGWVKSGRSFWYSPAAVESLMAGEVPAGLDQLVADVQAP